MSIQNVSCCTPSSQTRFFLIINILFTINMICSTKEFNTWPFFSLIIMRTLWRKGKMFHKKERNVVIVVFFKKVTFHLPKLSRESEPPYCYLQISHCYHWASQICHQAHNSQTVAIIIKKATNSLANFQLFQYQTWIAQTIHNIHFYTEGGFNSSFSLCDVIIIHPIWSRIAEGW